MGHFDDLLHAADDDCLVAPIELAGVTGRKRQGYKHPGGGWGLGTRLFPVLHHPLYRRVAPAITVDRQTFKQAARRVSALLGQAGIELQPGVQLLEVAAELGIRLVLSHRVNRVSHRFEMLTNGRAGELKLLRQLTDSELLNKMQAPDFGNLFHVYHSRFLRQKAGH